MKYRTILADPPWPDVKRRIGKGGRRSNVTLLPYRAMSYAAIRDLDVEPHAADDCVLFLWSTRRTFREGEAVKVARAWGFEPCGEIIWGLRNSGTGTRTFANDHEPVLVARRGYAPVRNDEPLGVWFWKQVYEYGPAGVPQKKQSAKPPGFFELVERIALEPRLEMFSREQRLGWDTWGNEAFCHIDLLADTAFEPSV